MDSPAAEEESVAHSTLLLFGCIFRISERLAGVFVLVETRIKPTFVRNVSESSEAAHAISLGLNSPDSFIS